MQLHCNRGMTADPVDTPSYFWSNYLESWRRTWATDPSGAAGSISGGSPAYTSALARAKRPAVPELPEPGVGGWADSAEGQNSRSLPSNAQPWGWIRAKTPGHEL